jgi:hypothetical protein
MAIKDKTVRSGRPPKFREPHHPVTMTLPKRILDQLAQIDPDRAQAVVKVTEAVFGTDRGRFKPVELVEMAPGKSLIVVGPSKALEQIPWLKRIEISHARYLLSVPLGTPIEALEVALLDLLQNPRLSESEYENSILHELVNLIGNQRRNLHLSKEEILIINMH